MALHRPFFSLALKSMPFSLFISLLFFCCVSNDKNRLKLFIYSQWTTKWSSIDQLTIDRPWKKHSKRAYFMRAFWTSIHNGIAFEPHHQCINSIHKREQAKKQSPFMLPLCLHRNCYTFQFDFHSHFTLGMQRKKNESLPCFCLISMRKKCNSHYWYEA